MPPKSIPKKAPAKPAPSPPKKAPAKPAPLSPKRAPSRPAPASPKRAPLSSKKTPGKSRSPGRTPRPKARGARGRRPRAAIKRKKRRLRIQLPPFDFKRYISESLNSIAKFFQFVFAGDFVAREKDLLQGSISFMHYR